MADSIHFALSQFRDTMLTAIARLEFTIRDTHLPTKHSRWSNCDSSDSYSTIPRESDQNLVDTLQMCMQRLASLEQKMDSQRTMVDEILSIQPPVHTRNILVPSVRSTPALAAAVAAANPSEFILSSFGSIKQEPDDEEEVDEEVDEEDDEVTIVETQEEELEFVDVTEEDEEEEENDDEEGHVEEEEDNELQQIIIDEQVYYIDKDQAIYTETDEGYEQIGTYDKQTKTITRFEEEEVEGENEEEEGENEEEEEEEEVIVEDFVYKGTTYQRDEQNNVYFDGEPIGTWNGKKIVKTA